MNGPATKGTKLRVVNIGCKKSYDDHSGEAFKYMHKMPTLCLAVDYNGLDKNIQIAFGGAAGYDLTGYIATASDFMPARKTIIVVEE